MKILIVSVKFPPENSIGAVRLGKTAKYLTLFGHDVYVLTAKHKLNDASLPIEIPEEKVVHVRYTPFSEYSGNMANRTSLFRILNRLTISLTRLNPWYLLREDTISALPIMFKNAELLLNQWKPDILYSSALPITSHLVASKISKKYNIPWIAEYRDLYSGGPGADKRLDVLSKLINPVIEKSVLKQCKALITVSPPLMEWLNKKYSIPSYVVYNGYDIMPEHKLTEKAVIRKNELNIVYMGTVYHQKDVNWDPEDFFIGINKLEDEKNCIKVFFFSGQNPWLSRMVHKYGLDDQVSLMEKVSYSESLALQANADILLFVSHGSKNDRGKGILSGKAFEYIGAERPILAIGNDEDHILNKKGFFENCKDSDEVAMKLRQWILEKKTHGFIKKRHNPPSAEYFSRKSQTKLIEDIMISVLQGEI